MTEFDKDISSTENATFIIIFMAAIVIALFIYGLLDAWPSLVVVGFAGMAVVFIFLVLAMLILRIGKALKRIIELLEEKQ